MIDFGKAMNKDESEPVKDVVKKDPFDPQSYLHHFEDFKKKIEEMKEMADSHSVDDDKTNTEAVEMTTQAKKVSQEIEKKRVELKAPFHAITSFLDSETRLLKNGLGEVQHTLNNKIQPYLMKLENERIEAQRKAEEEARAEQERLDEIRRQEQDRLAAEAMKAAEEKGLSEKEQQIEAEMAAALVPQTPEIVTNVPKNIETKTQAGTAKLKGKTVWKIFDFSSIPDEIIKERFDHLTKAIAPAINARIKVGIQNIPGVKIYEEKVLETRTNK